MFRGLRTVTYAVKDLTAAKEWYASLLGYAPYFDEPFYVGFDVGGYELGLVPAEEGDAPGVGGATAHWGVESVPKALALAIERGAKPLRAAQDVGGGIVVGAVIDPFGNVLGLIDNPSFAPPLSSAEAGDVSDRAIVKEVVVKASAEDVFSLWSSSEGMAKWWATKSRIELRPGGFYELYFMDEAPAGSKGSETCRILSYLPGRMLSFTWNAPPQIPSTRDKHTWVVLDLLPEGDATRVRLTHLGWPESTWESAAWSETFDYFNDAWGRVMEALAKHFA